VIVTLDQLCAIMPRLIPPRGQAYLEPLNSAMAEFEVNTPKRAAAFLAQIALESGELRRWEEATEGHAYEPTSTDPGDQRRARNLGNTEPGDGARFKGRGPIQLTGRFNYRLAGRALEVPLDANPTLAATPTVGFRVAGWFWRSHNCNEFADADDFRRITRTINGGYTDQERRERYWATAKLVFGLT
jgi:predicted chitinase